MEKQILQVYTEEMAKALVKAFSKIDKKELKGEGTFEVIATTEGVDRDGEIILISGWNFDNFLKNPVLLFGHDYWSFPIGAVTELREEDGKIIASGVFARTEQAQIARQLYDDGFLKATSVGFIPRKREGNVITEAELLELSFVPVPSNPEALDTRKELAQVKAFEDVLKTSVQTEKTVVPFKETEKSPEDAEFVAKDVLAKLKEWATDEEGKMDFDKYKQAFAYVDSDNPEKLESYKLPHHTVIGDKLSVVWQGTMAAMSAILGDKDETGIPEAQIEGVYKHLSKHYKQFEKEAPEFKGYTPYEIDNMFPTLKEAIHEDQKEHVDYLIKTLKQDVNNLLAGAVEKIGAVIGEPKKDAKPISKAGRTLSRKTRNTMSNAVESMGKAISDLSSLLESADASDDDDGKAADKDFLKKLQGADKVIEEAIKAVKARIK